MECDLFWKSGKCVDDGWYVTIYQDRQDWLQYISIRANILTKQLPHEAFKKFYT